jgi:hypothetical protein
MSTFDIAYFYYKAHQAEIIKGHLGEQVIIYGRQVIGYYEGLMEALAAATDMKLKPGTYQVQKCEPVNTPIPRVVDLHFTVGSRCRFVFPH